MKKRFFKSMKSLAWPSIILAFSLTSFSNAKKAESIQDRIDFYLPKGGVIKVSLDEYQSKFSKSPIQFSLQACAVAEIVSTSNNDQIKSFHGKEFHCEPLTSKTLYRYGTSDTSETIDVSVANLNKALFLAQENFTTQNTIINAFQRTRPARNHDFRVYMIAQVEQEGTSASAIVGEDPLPLYAAFDPLYGSVDLLHLDKDSQVKLGNKVEDRIYTLRELLEDTVTSGIGGVTAQSQNRVSKVQDAIQTSFSIWFLPKKK